MGYSSTGPKPFEAASKATHHHIINDPIVQAKLSHLWIPPLMKNESLADLVLSFQPVKTSTVTDVVAVDGGYTETKVRKDFPSAIIHFFQFGALRFERDDLKKLEQTPYIAPEDMARLKNIERLKLMLPTKGVRFKDKTTLLESVRIAVYDFFAKETLGEEESLLDTLKWFVYRRYKNPSQRTNVDKTWLLSSNPLANGSDSLNLQEINMSKDGTFACPVTGGTLYLTDIFRFHEVIDEEMGAAGVCGYLAGVIEHMVILHIIRHVLRYQPGIMNNVLFIMDRPTGFFGQTARLHVLMNELVCWLLDNHNLLLAGLEKSGAFVDHARDVQQLMPAGSYLILGDKYIYRYISPGQEDPTKPYASTSYYGHKVIFKTHSGQMHVLSLPVRKLKKEPKTEDLPNLDLVLTHIEELHCDMYDSALIPIVLANKLVSLAAHPSSQILMHFAKSKI